MMSSHKHILLFFLFAGVYLLTLRGTHTSVDDIPRYNLTIAIVTKATFEIPPSIMTAATNVDGRTYSKYGPGMSVAMVPLWAVGQGLAAIVPEPLWRAMERPVIFAMSTTNQWLGALAVALLFLVARRVGFRERTALLVALSAGLGSMLWLNAQTSFENILVLVLIGLAVLGLMSNREKAWLAAAGAGAALGFVFLTRWADGWILLPGAAFLLVARVREDRAQKRHVLAFIAAFVVPLLLGIGLAMAYNWVRFLDPFELGYDDDNVSWRFLPRGLFGFLLSPAKSVFVFTPLLVLAIAGFRGLWQRMGGGLRATGFFWLVGAPLVAYSCFETWDGGWCFGPRYLLPSVLLALVALGEWIEDERWQQRLWRPALFVILLSLGVYAQVICLGSNFNEYADNYYVFRYWPEACPLWACTANFFRPSENFWLWKIWLLPDFGLLGLPVLLLPLALLCAGIVQLRRELASMLSDARDRVRPAGPALMKVALGIVIAAALIGLGRRTAGALRGWRLPEGSGLQARYFPNARWQPPIKMGGSEPWLDFDWSRKRPFPGDFSIHWEGQIQAPTSGTYFFALDACGTATLALDRRVIIVNPGPQPGRRQIVRSVFLTEGWHHIALAFAFSLALDSYEFNGVRYARARHLPTGLRLRWKPPGAIFLHTIPPHVLRP